MCNMANYYFLVAAFPPLSPDAKPDLSFQEVRELFALNLTAADLGKVERLLRPIDLYNIRALWLGAPLDHKGNLSAKELEEELLVGDTLPGYLIEYLQKYESPSDRLRYFSSLFASLYREEGPHLNGFLLVYYRFEREVRLVLTALRAKRSGQDLPRQLQFEDPTDPWIAEILAQKEAPDYTPPREFEDLKTLFVDNCSDPRKLHRAIVGYQFRKIEEMERPEDFGIDRVLAYLARLILVESVTGLDVEKGKEQLSQYE